MRGEKMKLEKIVNGVLKGAMIATVAVCVSCSDNQTRLERAVDYTRAAQQYRKDGNKTGEREMYRRAWLMDLGNVPMEIKYADSLAESSKGFSLTSTIIKEHANKQLRDRIKKMRPVWWRTVARGTLGEAESALGAYKFHVELYESNTLELAQYYKTHKDYIDYQQRCREAQGLQKEYENIKFLRSCIDKR